MKLISVADERWKRCWIKAIALLPNILAKSHAVKRRYDEAVFVENGMVTRMLGKQSFRGDRGRLITHPVGPKVLPGITRAVLLECAGELGIEVRERPMTETEAMAADEVFITSTTREISWATSWNGQSVGVKKCGPITLALHRALREKVRQGCADPSHGRLSLYGFKAVS